MTNNLVRQLHLQSLWEAARRVNAATISHVNGRDLLAELHPRHEIDIKVRVDGRERWHEGDWLSTLFEQIKELRRCLAALELDDARPDNFRNMVASGSFEPSPQGESAGSGKLISEAPEIP